MSFQYFNSFRDNEFLGVSLFSLQPDYLYSLGLVALWDK
jgi:hypothetical protein